MARQTKQYTETCPICTGDAREPGITSMSLFVCDDHMGEFIASRCVECGRGIFVFRKNNGVRCDACLSKSKWVRRVQFS